MNPTGIDIYWQKILNLAVGRFDVKLQRNRSDMSDNCDLTKKFQADFFFKEKVFGVKENVFCMQK